MAEAPAPDLERFRHGLARASRRQGWFERLLRGVIRVACRLAGWRVAIDGLERLPVGPDGRAGAGCLVAIAPHRAWIDPFLLLAAWPPGAVRLAWIGDGAMMARSRWRRWLLPRIGMIPIDRDAGGPEAYAGQVRAVLAGGGAVVILPEVGPPSAPDRTRRISRGFAYLALSAGAPIVPVALGGTHRIVRRSWFSVDVLPALDTGPALSDPFTPEGRRRAVFLTDAYAAAIASVLPDRAAEADARRPARDQWRFLGTLFH